jgi:hypothetical protein
MTEQVNSADTSQETVDTTQQSTETTDSSAQTQEQEESTLLGNEGKKDETTTDDGQKKVTDTTEDGKSEEAKPGEVPEKYEIKLDEGFELDQGSLDLFTPIFKELGITNEGAQKLVDTYVPMIQGMEEKIRKESLDEFKKITDGWKADTLKELGPDSDKKLAICAKAINKFGEEGLRDALDQTGFGNHPLFVKFVMRVGEIVSEDTVSDQPKRIPGSTGQEQLNKMYPTMTK